MGINVISFFDGISAGQQALASLGIEVDNYIAVEIDEEAREITKKNFPNTIFWGDITQLMDDESFYESLPKIDLVFAGSPCTTGVVTKSVEPLSNTVTAVGFCE